MQVGMQFKIQCIDPYTNIKRQNHIFHPSLNMMAQ